MQKVEFRYVIGLWPSVEELATDLQEKRSTVEKWRTRNRIPSRVWQRLLTSAQTRELPITGDLLIRIDADR